MNSRRQLWRRFWEVAKPYWLSSEKWRAVSLLSVVIVLSIGSSSFLVMETLQRGELVSSLAAQDASRFLRALLILGSIVILTIPLLSFKSYLQAKLSLHWRRWLTRRFLRGYFDNLAFYRLQFNQEIDNPDQRIAEDINNFTQQSLYLLVILTDSIIQLVLFTGVIWSVSPTLVAVLLVYAVGGTLVTTLVFARKLTAINFVQLEKEADFRFSLIRVRENAEAIAFYRGKQEESSQVKQYFFKAFHNFNRLIRWQFGLTIFQNGYQYINFILPFIILAPQILAGQLEVGTVTQSQAAFERIGFALGLIINQFEKLSAFSAGVSRLEALNQFIESEKTVNSQLEKKIRTEKNSYLEIENLTLKTPQSQTTLIRDLSFRVLPNESLLIMGASGAGKSSLLRAIAGIWNFGEGTIKRPLSQDLLFLPQHPYMILGSLRQQLLYPQTNREISSYELTEMLKKVNLSNLAPRFKDLDVVRDWSKVLSIGEQQRLAFARLLLTEPKYALLDEATSALDTSNEAMLYQELAKTEITYISVGHNPSLVKYHQRVLEIK